jgi:hypothetical protein
MIWLLYILAWLLIGYVITVIGVTCLNIDTNEMDKELIAGVSICWVFWPVILAILFFGGLYALIEYACLYIYKKLPKVVNILKKIANIFKYLHPIYTGTILNEKIRKRIKKKEEN